MIRLDALDEGGHCVGVLVVDHQRGGRSAGRLHQLAGLLDRLGTVGLGSPGRPAATPGGVHVSAGLAQLDRDGASRAASGPGNQGDLPGRFRLAIVHTGSSSGGGTSRG